MMVATSLHFAVPKIIRSELEVVAKALSVEITEDSKDDLNNLQNDLKPLRVEGEMNPSLLADFTEGKVEPTTGIEMLKGIIKRHRTLFGWSHPGVLNYILLLEKLQRSIGSQEADTTKEEYQKWFLTILGFSPAPLKEYSRDQLLEQAAQGQDSTVDEFLDSCPTRFTLTPQEIPVIADLLADITDCYSKANNLKRAIHVGKIILLVPEQVQMAYPEFYADKNLDIGSMLLHVRDYQVGEDYFNNAIKIC